MYDIQVKPYIGSALLYGDKSFKFDGLVNISVKCVNATNRIVLHEKHMVINSIRFYHAQWQGGPLRPIQVNSFVYDSKFEFLTVLVDERCIENNIYMLSINYTGEISDSLEGFYRSSYADTEGKIQL
jgi:hypothetical protein